MNSDPDQNTPPILEVAEESEILHKLSFIEEGLQKLKASKNRHLEDILNLFSFETSSKIVSAF